MSPEEAETFPIPGFSRDHDYAWLTTEERQQWKAVGDLGARAVSLGLETFGKLAAARRDAHKDPFRLEDRAVRLVDAALRCDDDGNGPADPDPDLGIALGRIETLRARLRASERGHEALSAALSTAESDRDKARSELALLKSLRQQVATLTEAVVEHHHETGLALLQALRDRDEARQHLAAIGTIINRGADIGEEVPPEGYAAEIGRWIELGLTVPAKVVEVPTVAEDLPYAGCVGLWWSRGEWVSDVEARFPDGRMRVVARWVEHVQGECHHTINFCNADGGYQYGQHPAATFAEADTIARREFKRMGGKIPGEVGDV